MTGTPPHRIAADAHTHRKVEAIANEALPNRGAASKFKGISAVRASGVALESTRRAATFLRTQGCELYKCVGFAEVACPCAPEFSSAW
jgi:hypothetical protein